MNIQIAYTCIYTIYWPAVNIVKKSTSLSHYCKLLYLRNSDVQLGFLHSKSGTLFFFKATC